MNHAEICAQLRRLPGLDNASNEAIGVLAAEWSPVEMVGRTFLTEGKQPDGLYLLVDGQVEIVRSAADGDRVMVGFLEPPDLLGFAGVLTNKEAIASARARGKVVLLRMDAARARDLLHRDDDVSAVLRRGLLVALARRTAVATRLLAQLSTHARRSGEQAPLVI